MGFCSAAYVCAQAVALAGVLLSFVLIAKAWSALPEEIAIHYGLSGEPDGWGSKRIIFTLPLLSAFIWISFIVPAALYRPGSEGHHYYYYVTLWLLAFCGIEVVWLFTYITWRTIQVALGRATGLGRWFLALSTIPLALTIIVAVVLAAKGK